MMVTKQFERVIEKVGKLPAKEQNALAGWILEELEDEKRWSESFAASQDLLAKMADKAIQDHEHGKTKPLDPSNL
ncbi:MAG: hypothetical protein AB1649_20400 [Chloroflexota bacterium]